MQASFAVRLAFGLEAAQHHRHLGGAVQSIQESGKAAGHQGLQHGEASRHHALSYERATGRAVSAGFGGDRVGRRRRRRFGRRSRLGRLGLGHDRLRRRGGSYFGQSFGGQLGEVQDSLQFFVGEVFFGFQTVGVGDQGGTAFDHHRAAERVASLGFAYLQAAHLDGGAEQRQVDFLAGPDAVGIELAVAEHLEFVIALIVIQDQHAVGGQVHCQQRNQSLGEIFDRYTFG